MYELPHKLPNDLRLKILEIGKFQENPWNAWIDTKYPVIHPKAKFWQFLVKICPKSAVKNSIKTPIFCLTKQIFIYDSVQTPWFYIFWRF